MSDSGSFESAKDDNFEANEESNSSDESDDEPLVSSTKKLASPKKSPSKSPVKATSGKKGRPKKEEKRGRPRKEEKVKGRVSFALVESDRAADKEEEYEVKHLCKQTSSDNFK